MGKHDSTETRVVPIFDQLYQNDRSGQSWIRKLISLPVGGQSVLLPVNCDLTIQEAGWGDKEKGPPGCSAFMAHSPPTSALIGNAEFRSRKGSEAKRMDCRFRDTQT